MRSVLLALAFTTSCGALREGAEPRIGTSDEEGSTDSTESGASLLRVLLHDEDSEDLSGLWVTVASTEVHEVDGDAWVEVSQGAREIDLLALQNDRAALLGEVVSDKEINQIRLYVEGTARGVRPDGTTVEVKVPSEKIHIPLSGWQGGYVVAVDLDWNVADALHCTGSGTCILNPVIHAVVEVLPFPDAEPAVGDAADEGGVIGDGTTAGVAIVPEESYVGDVRIEIHEADAAMVAMPVEDGLSLISAVRLEPSGTTFDEPIVVIVPLSSRMEPGAWVEAVSFDEDAGEWRRSRLSDGSASPAVVMGDGRHVALLADHFSYHGVALPTLGDFRTEVVGYSEEGVPHRCSPWDSIWGWDGGLWGIGGLEEESERYEAYVAALTLALEQPEMTGASSAVVDAIGDFGEVAAFYSRTADAGDAAFVSDAFTRHARSAWGWWEGADPDRFKYTTLLNTRNKFGQLTDALSVAGLVFDATSARYEAMLTVALGYGIEQARLDALETYLDSSGLSADPAVQAAFDDVRADIEARQALLDDELVEAILAAGDGAALDTIFGFVAEEALTGPVASLVAARLGYAAGPVGVALGALSDLIVGNLATQDRIERQCALSTLYYTGLADAELDVNGVPLSELRYASWASFARGRVAQIEGDELPTLSWLLTVIGRGIADAIIAEFGGLTTTEQVAYWENQEAKAIAGLEVLATLTLEPGETEAWVAESTWGGGTVSFSCLSDPSVDEDSCGDAELGCYCDGDECWAWTYGVTSTDCTASYEILADRTAEAEFFWNVKGFCDQFAPVQIGVYDDVACTLVEVDQYSPTLTDLAFSLGTFQVTEGQTYTVEVYDAYSGGYTATPSWCVAIGGADHLNVNFGTVTIDGPAVGYTPLDSSTREWIAPDQASVLAWPLASTGWYDVPGSIYHQCSDEFALDLNLPYAGHDTCDVEIDEGPHYVRAPISGSVIFAGESPYDPGRGWQVVIESAIEPGFVVSLIHLQEFDAAAVLGTELVVGDALLAAVGDTGTDCAHLHVSAWRGVISGDARDRVERGQSPEGYTCTSSQYAVPFELNPAW